MKINQAVLDWLLEPSQPAVRYHTLLDLMDHPKKSAEVGKALSNIPKIGWANEILGTQKTRGYWESQTDLYRPKYTATIWRLIVLADLGMTAKNDHVRRPCEFFLNQYSRPDGGFDTPSSTWIRSEVCLTGNLARTLLLCGYGDDPRVRSAFDWLVEHQMDDGGWHCFYERAFGRGTLDCWEALSAYAALPSERWTRRIKRSIGRGAEFYLARELFKQGHRRYIPWLRFHYPVHYYYDLLVGLDVLTQLGYAGDRRLKAGLQILNNKRRADGTWALDAVHPDLGAEAGYRFKTRPKRFALEREGKPSKWITLMALRVLKRVDDVRT
jgi:hypothetical protein